LARLRRNGTSLHYETHGQGAPILLTHGFGATTRMWDEQIEEFTDRYRLILWDLTPQSLTRDVLAILNAAETERIVLIGLGIGGALSIRCCHEFPNRVRGLVLIGTMPGLRSGAARQIWNEQVGTMATSLERDGLDALEGGAEVDPRLHTDALGLATAARAMLTQTDDGTLPYLGIIDVPVLILVGSEDRPNLSAADYMARVMPNARRIVIPRANHAANIHKPGLVNAAIRDFLERIPP
jgi:pimeloyl-ACP methyl ester carboxylesterase